MGNPLKVASLQQALALRRSEARAPANPDFAALNAIIARIRTRFHSPATFVKLTHGEQVVYELGYTLDAEVQNGGWHQYLSNSSGDGAEDHKAYLREVGASEVLRLLEQISRIFPNALVPRDRRERSDLLRGAIAENAAIAERLLEDADRVYYRECARLYTRLMDFVENQPKEFENPKEPARGDRTPRRRRAR